MTQSKTHENKYSTAWSGSCQVTLCGIASLCMQLTRVRRLWVLEAMQWRCQVLNIDFSYIEKRPPRHNSHLKWHSRSWWGAHVLLGGATCSPSMATCSHTSKPDQGASAEAVGMLKIQNFQHFQWPSLKHMKINTAQHGQALARLHYAASLPYACNLLVLDASES